MKAICLNGKRMLSSYSKDLLLLLRVRDPQTMPLKSWTTLKRPFVTKRRLIAVTHHVAVSSNCVERLFSMRKRTITDHGTRKFGRECSSPHECWHADLWLNRAPQIIQEIINEEVHSARAAKATALASPAASDITTDFDLNIHVKLADIITIILL